MKKQTNAVVITPSYQNLFVAAVLGSWLVETGFLVHDLMAHYTNRGTWTFQLSLWIFPVLLFVLSAGFALRLYRPWTQRLFMAAFMSTIAMSVYSALSVAENFWYARIYSPKHPLGTNASYWQIFGNYWVLMAITLTGYIALLLCLHRRKK